MQNRKNGSVMIVGGGIAGIQSSLDLANAGFHVYLVESSPTIGGLMARLDKTFPTNDCSMCILSPKLVECGRHLNIDILSYAEVDTIAGEPGNFRVSVRNKARYVDPGECTGCGDCAEACPVEVPNHCENYLNTRKVVYRPFPQAFPNAFTIEKHGVANCQAACPLEQKAQGYVALLRAGRYEDAGRTVRLDNPFPAICGRACHHPCMEACQRGELDEPLGIPHLKRFLADYETDKGLSLIPEKEPARENKVAVVGAGPSGLSCAWFLSLRGYQVTVFDEREHPGGMMRYGIPSYRLPRNVVGREIDTILEGGVELQTGRSWGRDFTLDDLKKMGFEAAYLACGAWRGMKSGAEGEDHPRVMDGLDYLERVNSGREVPTAEDVVIVGGGNVAIDCARSALRRGARRVSIYYRRSREEMPARDEEIEDAISEGVEIFYCASPKRFTERSGTLYLETYVMRLCAPDESGRRKPEPIPGVGFEVAGDLFILAIGQKPAVPEEGLEFERWGTVKVNKRMETSRPGVFAGGDLVLGPATLVEAIAHGKRAAASIHAFLCGETYTEEERSPAPLRIDWGEKLANRIRMKTLPLEERKAGFEEVEIGYSEEEAKEEAARCLSCGGCSECMQCVVACQRNAINHRQNETLQEIEVGAILFAAGAEAFDPVERYRELGYRRFPNVVTSLDFERILNASGPFQGKVVRPSDGNVPRRIGFVQCVGSRDKERGKGYCSSVCCMYAIKEALVAQEHLAVEGHHEKEAAACAAVPSASCGESFGTNPLHEDSTQEPDDAFQATVFMIDMRSFGKDFERYYERAKREGIRFVRGKVDRIRENPNGDLEIAYSDGNGGFYTETFEMVVLSVGLAVTTENLEQLERLGFSISPDGLMYTDPARPVRSTTPGVWVCGTLSAPKDIPDTVVEASAASAEVGSFLHDARFTQVREKSYPAERDISREPLRIGVFICHCGINIGGVVGVSQVAEEIRNLPGVVYVEENLYTCSQDTQQKMRELIDEHGLNRVVVASCSPRTHEPLFQETLKEAGLNPYLFEMANIRDQCSWVHQKNPQEATKKATELVAMSVAKASFLEPLTPMELEVEKGILVVGGGVSGMSAALEAARQGLHVYLVEKEDTLGGVLRRYRFLRSTDGIDYVALRNELERELHDHPKVKIFTSAHLKEVNGFVGNFESVIESGYEEYTIRHGAVVIATGGREHRPREFLYGEDERVLTQTEFSLSMQDGKPPQARKVVMIQCVGSRNEENPWCSKVCCTTAVRNAITLKRLDPSAEVYILYRDMRTYGLGEHAYREARELGVVFIRFEDDVPPRLKREGKALLVEVDSPLFGETVTLPADLVVLSAGIEPQEGNEALAKMVKVPLNQDGFFLEAHVKLRPVEFSTDGVYVCGLAHAPKLVPESVLQGEACISRAMTVLSKDSILSEAQIAQVLQSRCTACGDCEAICQYKAVKVNEEEKIAEVNAALCKGCGLCGATCKSGAIQVRGFAPEQIVSEVEFLL